MARTETSKGNQSYRVLNKEQLTDRDIDKVLENWIRAESLSPLVSVHALVTVRDVEEVVFFVVLLVESTHRSTGGGDHIVDKEEQGVFWPQVDPLADEKVELPDGQVRRYQILLLVQITNPCFGCLFHNYLKNKGNKQNKSSKTVVVVDAEALMV